MKNLFTLLLVLLAFAVRSQTTITTGYAPTGVTFSTGLTYITFAIRNTNSYAITFTDLNCLQANLYENNVYSLWYSPTSLGGAPSVTSPTWTLVTTSLHPFSSSIVTYVNPFDCIGLTIPASTTYRFALQGTKGTAVRGAVSPNIFSAGGVDLLVGDNASTGGQVGYFGWQNLGNSGLPYFFDGSITFAQTTAFTDLYIKSIIKPTNICSATSNIVTAQVCNKSPHNISFGTNHATISLGVTGPIPSSSTITLSSGTLAPCACLNASFPGVNLSSAGTYTLTANSILSGVTESNLLNNMFVDSITNYKPIISPPTDSVCQYSSGPLFPGFSSSNCLPIEKSIVVNTLVASVAPVDGSNDASAGLFAQGSLPLIPAGAVITGGNLFVSNLNGQATGSFGIQARFNIYNPLAGPAAAIVPGASGNPLSFAVYNFDYSAVVTAAQLNLMYLLIGAGGNFNIGYWESVDNLVGGSDISINAQTLPTQAQLTIYYTMMPDVKWYTNATGGNSYFTGSPMNPFTSTGSGLSGTASTGNFTFYAACSADTLCRVPVVLKIKPSPAVVQDTIETCEVLASTGNGMFDLTTLSNNISAFNPLASVSYFQDANLSLLINTPTAYVSNSGFIYSKVQVAGCYSSDSVKLVVYDKPDFVNPLVSTSICQPGYLDATSLIDPFSTSPPGTDTLYFEDPGYSIYHPNPHNILSTDTVYMLFVTNTTPACKDSSMAILNVFPLNNFIVNQDTTFNFSISGSVGCSNIVLNDGNSDTLHSGSDCSRIVAINDVLNSVSLGTTTVCETIESSVLFHNGQPYVNRHYEISPTNNDSAIVCLYFLDDDLVQYNNAASGLWPSLPTALNPLLTANLCIAQTHNGDLNTPGHTVTSIPNTVISSTYDPATTVWTICFPVSSFSHFYLHAQNPLNIPLSAQLVRFTASRDHENSVIEWITSGELNNNYFIVERSDDGDNFNAISSPILSQAMNGNSQQELKYSFIDTHPRYGMNYYRLRTVDIDGKEGLSEIATVYFEKEIAVRLYPNPVQDELKIEIRSAKNCNALIRVLDATGRVVKTIDLLLQSGPNKTSVDLNELADGVYLVTVQNKIGLNYTETIRKGRR